MIKIKNVAKIQLYLINKIRAIFFIFFLSLLVTSCASNDENKDGVTKKKRVNPNPQEKAREFADKNPIFDQNRNKSGGTFEFSSSNILWRASLKTLDFIPLNNTDYSGGVIVTDWYGNEKEQIKISVRFLSNEISSSAVKVISHKKICNLNNCTTTPLDEKFNQEIKNKIINEAKNLKIKEEKNK